MSETVTLGFGTGTLSPVQVPTVTQPSTNQPSGLGIVQTGYSFAQLFNMLLLVFPPSWIVDAFGPLSDGSNGTATAALFTAIANTMAVPGDWILPNSSVPASYTVSYTNQAGQPVTQTFKITSKLQQQMRLRSMTGNALDNAFKDFYGLALPRLPSEPDSTYLARGIAGLFALGITRPNLYRFLTTYTGIAPHMIDPNVPADVGGYTSCTNIAGITTIGGKKCYPTFDVETNARGPSSGPNYAGLAAVTCPPCYYGTDVGGATFRYSNPNGIVQAPGVYWFGDSVFLFQNGWQGGFAYQALIITTYPQGFGAQGNAAVGYATASGTIAGSPKVYPTVVGGGGGYCMASSISIVGGRSVYTSVTGDAASAYFYPRGLMPADLAAGRAQVLSALNRLRAAGVTLWVQVMPALQLVQAGYTS